MLGIDSRRAQREESESFLLGERVPWQVGVEEYLGVQEKESFQ